jgi:hypothetical protein
MSRHGLLLVVALLTGTLAACEDLEGTVHEVDRSHVPPNDNGHWASGPWAPTDPEQDGLIEIPPDDRIRLFHGLGRQPTAVHGYVGFSTGDARLMPATGNAVEIWEATEEFIEIRNRSGGSFFYRFVLY